MNHQKNKEILVKLSQDSSLLVKTQEPLYLHTSFKLGGPAAFFARADSLESLKRVLRVAAEFDLPVFVLGGGSNILFSDAGFNGIVLSLGEQFNDLEINGVEVKVGAARFLKNFISNLAESGIGGFEFAWGIPGTMGGALFGNAGTKTEAILDRVLEINLLTFAGEEKTLSLQELKPGYRFSGLENQDVILTAARLKGVISEPAIIRKRLDALIDKRKETQPLEWPCAGSVFKNPEGYFAAELIEKAGGKGLKKGGAMVSTKHANFIVNTGKATAKEVLALIAELEKLVFDAHKINLELEIKLVGF